MLELVGMLVVEMVHCIQLQSKQIDRSTKRGWSKISLEANNYTKAERVEGWLVLFT